MVETYTDLIILNKNVQQNFRYIPKISNLLTNYTKFGIQYVVKFTELVKLNKNVQGIIWNIPIKEYMLYKSQGFVGYKAPDLSHTTPFSFTNHTITVDVNNKKITSYVSTSNGYEDYKYYDWTNEYSQVQNTVDATVGYNLNGLNLTGYADLTNGKHIERTSTLTKQDAESLSAALQSLYSKYCGLWIKVGTLEYLFQIIDRNKQPDINAAYQPAIDGTPQYQILGKGTNKWSFDILVDSFEKEQILENLANNSVCFVKFDEIGDSYKQALITNVEITRITTFKYNASIDLVIL